MCWLPWNLGASTSWNTLGLSRPVMGLLYLLYITVETLRSVFIIRNYCNLSVANLFIILCVVHTFLVITIQQAGNGGLLISQICSRYSSGNFRQWSSHVKLKKSEGCDFCGMWCNVAWQTDINVSVEPAVSIFTQYSKNITFKLPWLLFNKLSLNSY